jgi:hypothetical protein
MNLYTHAVLAQALQPMLNPSDPAEYLWGALAPDIRYLAGTPRESTHLADAAIHGWADQFPGWRSFVQGYRVHCLLDRIDTVQSVSAAFPLRWLRRGEYSPQRINVVIELYYQFKAPSGVQLSGGHNPILDSLGIRAEQSQAFASALAFYLRKPTFQNAVQTFTQLGIINDARLEKYMQAYQNLRHNPLMLLILTSSVHNARLEAAARHQMKELPL